MYVIYMCVFVFLINLYYHFLHYYFYILYDWNDVVLLRLILFFCFEFVVYAGMCVKYVVLAIMQIIHHPAFYSLP